MDNATAILKRIGLNKYETSIYIALLGNGNSSPGELSRLADVPRSRIYDVLSSLEKKGFALAQFTKPVRYAPVAPDRLSDILRSGYKRELESKISELDSLKGSLVSALEPLYSQEKDKEKEGFSGIIKNSRNIHRKIEEMVHSSKSSICKVSSHEGLKEMSKQHHAHLRTAKKRGVKIKFMGNIKDHEELSHLRKVSSVRHIDGIEGRFLIKDGKEALVLLTPHGSKKEIGMLVKNDYFAGSMQQIFDHYWEHAKEI